MNRRGFLQRVCQGVVGAAAIAHVPSSWIPAPVSRCAIGTVGGINRASYSFWRNQQVVQHRPLTADMIRALTDTYRDCR